MMPASFAVFGGCLQFYMRGTESFPKAALDGVTHSLRFIGPTEFY